MGIFVEIAVRIQYLPAHQMFRPHLGLVGIGKARLDIAQVFEEAVAYSIFPPGGKDPGFRGNYPDGLTSRRRSSFQRLVDKAIKFERRVMEVFNQMIPMREYLGSRTAAEQEPEKNPQDEEPDNGIAMVEGERVHGIERIST